MEKIIAILISVLIGNYMIDYIICTQQEQCKKCSNKPFCMKKIFKSKGEK